MTKFLKENFEPPGSEFEPWSPPDFNPNPPFLSNISNLDYRSWASDLNVFWSELGRKMTSDVEDNPDRYSIIPVPNPVIVPGGRFREFYYWDSYWIIKGLLLSGMTEVSESFELKI